MYTRKYSPVISPPPDYSGTSFLPPAPMGAEPANAFPARPAVREMQEPPRPHYPLEAREAYTPTVPKTLNDLLPSQLSALPEDELLLIGLFLLILYGKKDGIRENGDALCLLAFLFFYGREKGDSCRNPQE